LERINLDFNWEKWMKISVVGAGYVGLVTAACFASKKNTVILIERDLNKIKSLCNGQIPFYEPGLDELVKDVIKTGKLEFVSKIETALEKRPEIIFSCVGTPPKPDGSADLSFVFSVAAEIGNHLKNECIIINKSTVPVGTAKKVTKIIQEKMDQRGASINFDVASNPEFLKEGDALNDFFMPDRVIIGTNNLKTKESLQRLYSPFLKSLNQFVCMGIESAEMAKYASNAMLATRISFMNQLSILADSVGADIEDVKNGMALDSRIGSKFLNSGIGYGGSCFPKDVKALIQMGIDNNQPMTLVSEVDKINEWQQNWFANKILNFYGKKIQGKKIGIWGLSFKPETDDIRCAPAINIIKKLLKSGASIIAYDPVAMENMKSEFGNSISFASDAKSVLDQSDGLIVLTEWKEFVAFPIDKLKSIKDKVIFDGRNIFDPKKLTELNIIHVTVGRDIVCKNKDIVYPSWQGSRRSTSESSVSS
jgi:UDPglucose 6-dehydrogenase